MTRRCACGSTKLLAVHPGNGASYAGPWKLPGGKVIPAILIGRAVDGVAYCEPCWIDRFGVRGEVVHGSLAS